MFKEAADVRTADTLDLEKPVSHVHEVVAQPSKIQRRLIKSLAKRAGKIRDGSVDPKDDNMLCVTNDGRKIGLDQRLMQPGCPDNPNSKVNMCVQNVFDIYTKTTPNRSTQLIFCDMSTPKSDTRQDRFEIYRPNEAKDSGYNTAVFTLKNTTGELLYKSSLKAVKDNTDVNKGSLTAAQIVKACKSAGITPVAAITTLYDRKTPYLFDNAGYIITDGNWSWLDAAADNGGKPWTTPYSADAVNYYADICGELAKAGFADIELENTVFPNFQSYDYSLLSKELQNANRSEKLAVLAASCAKKAKEGNATATVEIKADALLTMSATAYDGTAEIWSAKDKMGDSRVLVTMDMSLLGTKLQTSADKTVTVEKDKVKAVNQIFTLVKKAVGDKEISVGITGSANLSADEIKNCKTALEKLGFTDIRFE